MKIVKIKEEYSFVFIYIVMTLLWVVMSPNVAQTFLPGTSLFVKHIIFDTSFLLLTAFLFFKIIQKRRRQLEHTGLSLAAFFNQTYQFSVLLDTNGHILDINNAALDLLGETLKNIQRKQFSDTNFWKHSEADRLTAEQAIRNASLGIISRFTLSYTTITSTITEIDITVKPIFENNKITSLLVEGHDISNEVNARKKIEVKERELQFFFDNATSLMLLVNEKGEVIRINKTGLEIIGKENSQVLGLRGGDVINCVHTRDDKRGCGYGASCPNCDLRNSVNQTFTTQTGQTKKHGILNIHRASKTHQLYVLITTMYVPEYNPPAVLVVLDDITQLKETEKKLIRSSERYRYFIEKGFEGVFRFEISPAIMPDTPATDKSNKLLHRTFLAECNSVFLRSIENPEKMSVIGKSFTKLYGQNAAEKLINAFILNNFKLENFFLEVQPADKKKWFKISMFGVISNTILIGIWGSQIEVSSQVVAEQELRVAEDKYRTLVEKSPYAVYQFKYGFGGVYYSSKVQDIFGYSSEYLLSNPTIWIDSIHPDDVPVVQTAVEKHMKGEDFEIVYRIKHKNGDWRWLYDRNIGEYDKSGFINGIAMDITERKMIGSQLRESESKFQTIFDSDNHNLFIINENGIIIDANRSALKASERTYENLIDHDISDIFNSDSADYFKILNTCLKNIEYFGEHQYIDSKNILHLSELSAKLINNTQKPEILIVIRDVTSEKTRQQHLLQTIIETEEKERSRFAQDLHDGIGPLLSTIKLYTQWIAKADAKFDKAQLIQQAENTVNEAIRSVREISNNLSPHVLQNFGLISAIKSFADRVTETSDIEISINHNVTRKLGNHIETTIYRIVAECINNTIKYADATHADIEITLYEKRLNLIYRDNGIGFDVDSVLAQKTGHGLYNMKNRLKSLNGTIDIQSDTQIGTTILISINTTN